MIRTMRRAAAVTAVAATMTLGGCALITPTAPVKTPSALEACAHSTVWTLDTAALQAQLVPMFAESGVAVSEVLVSGTQTFEWTENGHVTIESAYTITATAPSDVAETPWIGTQTVTGTTTGRAYFSDVIAVPRDWNADGLVIETIGTKGAEPLEVPAFAVPRTILDDTVGLEVVCTPELMTTHGRGTDLVLTWLPAS